MLSVGRIRSLKGRIRSLKGEWAKKGGAAPLLPRSHRHAPVAASSRMLASTSGCPVAPSRQRSNRLASAAHGRRRPETPPSRKIFVPCFSAKKLPGLRGEGCVFRGEGFEVCRMIFRVRSVRLLILAEARQRRGAVRCAANRPLPGGRPPLPSSPAKTLANQPSAPVEIAPDELKHQPVGGLVGALLRLVPLYFGVHRARRQAAERQPRR